jgi:hypothetical protein
MIDTPRTRRRRCIGLRVLAADETTDRGRQRASGFTGKITPIIGGQSTTVDPIAEIEPACEHLDQRQMAEPVGVVEHSEIDIRRHLPVTPTGKPKITQPSQPGVPRVREPRRLGLSTVRRKGI